AREGIRVGEPLPAVALKELNGGELDLSQGDGFSRLVLLFVAADCPICRSVLPAFEEALVQAEHSRATEAYWVADGLQMADYDSYCQEHRIDPTRFIVSQELGLVLGVRQIPALVLLDCDRKLVALEVLNGPKQVERFFATHSALPTNPNPEKST
ncbi:MAG: TlpA family protein disulfide reductase, partial [Pseudomonadales bacterium]